MSAIISFPSLTQSLSSKQLNGISKSLNGQISDNERVNLFLKISAHAIAQGERNTARDSAITFARKAQELSKAISYDSGLVKGYLNEIQAWVRKGELEIKNGGDGKASMNNAKALQKKLIDYAKERGSLDDLGETYAMIARLYNRNSTDFHELHSIYDSAASCFRKSGNRIRESETLYFVGFNMWLLRGAKESIPIFHRSISIVQPEGRPKLFRVYGILGLTYNYLGSYSLALKYQLQALKLAEGERDTSYMTGGIHLFLGGNYRSLNNLALAEYHFTKAYEIYKYSTDINPNDFTSAVLNKANLMIKNDPKSAIDFVIKFEKDYPNLAAKPLATSWRNTTYMNAYQKLKDYKKANEFCDYVLRDIEKLEPVTKQMVYLDIGEYLVNTGQYEKAKKVMPIIQELRGQNPNALLQRANLLLSKIDSAQGNFSSAFARYKLSKAYGDSVLNEAKAKEIAALEIEYETEKKDKDILLLKQEGELQTARLEQSHFTRNITFAGAALLLLVAGLLYYLYLTKQKSNKQLTHLLDEKEWLLKEIHHRVKNNLQTVLSLLESQSRQLSNEAFDALQESQNRVYAMSLIHKKLYQSADVSSINMEDYLRDLVRHLRDSFGSAEDIRFSLQLDSVELDVSQAVPVGLIVNEAITNSIKYAFPSHKRDSDVNISLRKVNDNKVVLLIADNGVGISSLKENTQSLGLKLMRGLTEDIDGKFSIESKFGVTIQIEFVANVPFQKTAIATSNLYPSPITVS